MFKFGKFVKLSGLCRAHEFKLKWQEWRGMGTPFFASLICVGADLVDIVFILRGDLAEGLPLESWGHAGVIRVLAALVEPRDHLLVDEVEEFVAHLRVFFRN